MEIREIIKESGLTYEGICEACKGEAELTPAMLSYIAQGKVLPTQKQKEAIFRACGAIYMPADALVCKMTFRCPWWLRNLFNAKCKDRGITMHQWMMDALYKWVKEG